MATLDPRLYGGKAHFLSRLRALGVSVPAFVALPCDRPVPDEQRLQTLLERTLQAACDDSGRYNLAVRSSGLAEDSATASLAGSYTTVIGSFSPQELSPAIEKVLASGPPGSMGVILQRFVEPDFSGVVFSLDPITYNRDTLSLSWMNGRGALLVSGEEVGHSALVRGSDSRPSHWPGDHRELETILRVARLTEAAFGFPVDMEWVAAAQTVEFVQARPVVLPNRGTVALESGKFDLLPPIVRSHPKIALRQAASELRVPMSRASVHIWAGTGATATLEIADRASPSSAPHDGLAPLEGVSVVLLHPSHVGDKVVREFAPIDGTDVDFYTRECRRYAVRRYPAFSDVKSTVRQVLARGLQESWVAAAVDQEIHAADATGIVRASDTGFVVELARGHFVPKGIVTTSLFLLDASANVVDAQRRHQDVVVHFIDGHVVHEQAPDEQLPLTDDDVSEAVRQVIPLLERYPGSALEFGVLATPEGIKSYVIDVAESDCAAPGETSLLATGVVSPGRATGRAVRVSQSIDDDRQYNAHLLEGYDASQPLTRTIFFADRASVDLLPLIYRAGPNCAFVFKQASMLAHVAVVLRERGVPALALAEDSLTETHWGRDYCLDAATTTLSATERLKPC